MTAKRARKSPKVETICANQRRRMVTTRRTAPMESGSGGGVATGSTSSGLVGVWLMVVVSVTDAMVNAKDAEILSVQWLGLIPEKSSGSGRLFPGKATRIAR